MANNLRILFAPLDSTAHLNACIAVAQSLHERNHTIIFAIENSFRGKLTPYGFAEELYEDSSHSPSDNNGDPWCDFFRIFEEKLALSPLEKTRQFSVSSFDAHISLVKSSNDRLNEIISRNKPDVIVVDNYVCTPAIINCGIPWVLMVSCNPLNAIDDHRTPPSRSGFPINSDKTKWVEFRHEINQMFHNKWSNFNDWAVSEGSKPLPEGKFIPASPYLNLYGYPREIDYTDVRPLPDKWFQLDGYFRTISGNTFEIPEALNSKPGKLVYLSLGSICSSFVSLMTRLVSILGKSSHKFIVSKGPLHHKYELPANMWGESFLPQMQILPLVDLVITHGGNNTVCETLYFGKPMIVLPLSFDGYDNAQRVEEKGFGLRVDPIRCTEQQLLSAVDRLVSDQLLVAKLRAVSTRMQSENSLEKAANLIENLVFKS